MTLLDHTLFGDVDKVAVAIARLREFEPPEGYFLAYSGGKDSTVILALARMAGVRFEANYHATTIDPPELVRFIRQQDCVTFNRPATPFLTRLVEKGMPLRKRRWCCSEYKEIHGAGRIVVDGVRSEESTRRAGRRMMESCIKGKAKRLLHPILDWTSEEVWEFIKREHLPYCSLYDEGFKRLGCVLCPQAGPRIRAIEAARWPKYTNAFRAAFVRLFDRELGERERGETNAVAKWSDGSAMFDWWLRNDPSPNPAQGDLDFDSDDATGVYE